MTTPQPPPEAVLIAEMRLRPPAQSIRQAAADSGISETRWRQLEHGIRHFAGREWPERGPAKTIAKMARVVGVTPQQLTEAGRPDAAAELEALLLAGNRYFTGRQRRAMEQEMNGGDDDN